MRKALLMFGLVAALAFRRWPPPRHRPRSPAASAATTPAAGPDARRSPSSHSGSVAFLANIRHFLVVSYCKHYGMITSVSIAAHGCDTSGLVSCHTRTGLADRRRGRVELGDVRGTRDLDASPRRPSSRTTTSSR